jgi:hypothetical protein
MARAHTKSAPKSAAHRARRKSPDAPKTEPSTESPRRALWSGTLGFGLLQIPVNVYPLERAQEISFHQLY